MFSCARTYARCPPSGQPAEWLRGWYPDLSPGLTTHPSALALRAALMWETDGWVRACKSWGGHGLPAACGGTWGKKKKGWGFTEVCAEGGGLSVINKMQQKSRKKPELPLIDLFQEVRNLTGMEAVMDNADLQHPLN